MKIVWREWYHANDVAHMIKMGTLPREETEIDDYRFMTGTDAARMVAEDATMDGSELFRDNGTTITITEPAEFAGDYIVSVDYEPTFRASKVQV